MVEAALTTRLAYPTLHSRTPRHQGTPGVIEQLRSFVATAKNQRPGPWCASFSLSLVPAHQEHDEHVATVQYCTVHTKTRGCPDHRGRTQWRYVCIFNTSHEHASTDPDAKGEKQKVPVGNFSRDGKHRSKERPPKEQAEEEEEASGPGTKPAHKWAKGGGGVRSIC